MSALDELRAPCPHNAWDNVRMRGDRATLSCRVCGVEFKTRGLVEVACLDFRENGECPLGPSCPYLHVHRRKAWRASSMDNFGDHPQRDDVLHSVTLAVIRERGPGRVRCSTIASEVYFRVSELRSTQHYASPTPNLVGYVDCTAHTPNALDDSNTSFSEGLSSIQCGSPANSVGSIGSSILPTGINPTSPLPLFRQRQPGTAFSPSLLPVTEKFVPMQRAMSMSKRCIDERQ